MLNIWILEFWKMRKIVNWGEKNPKWFYLRNEYIGKYNRKRNNNKKDWEKKNEWLCIFIYFVYYIISKGHGHDVVEKITTNKSHVNRIEILAICYLIEKNRFLCYITLLVLFFVCSCTKVSESELRSRHLTHIIISSLRQDFIFE